mmetsp:Transcript_13360/g.40501  ORF Transcript_13360/g.40501 Transcript_13360/m.40501 type:complete len:216 (+) Transcript_13360:2-649(+)
MPLLLIFGVFYFFLKNQRATMPGFEHELLARGCAGMGEGTVAGRRIGGAANRGGVAYDLNAGMMRRSGMRNRAATRHVPERGTGPLYGRSVASDSDDEPLPYQACTSAGRDGADSCSSASSGPADGPVGCQATQQVPTRPDASGYPNRALSDCDDDSTRSSDGGAVAPLFGPEGTELPLGLSAADSWVDVGRLDGSVAVATTATTRHQDSSDDSA